MDGFAETAFNDLTRVAAEAFDVPMSSITIMGGGASGQRSALECLGAERLATRRAVFWPIETPDKLTVIEDTLLDPRFAAIPFAKNGLRFTLQRR